MNPTQDEKYFAELENLSKRCKGTQYERTLQRFKEKKLMEMQQVPIYSDDYNSILKNCDELNVYCDDESSNMRYFTDAIVKNYINYLI
jgi:hypothetical protein